jgi:hypothetical protein
LDDTVEDHRIAEKFGFDKLQVLILSLLIRKDSFDANPFAIVGVKFFSKPDAHIASLLRQL